MKENDLVTLDDGKRYLLANEVDLEENGKYFLAVEANSEGLNFKNSMFFKAGEDEEGEYLDDVINPDEIRALIGVVMGKEIIEARPELADELEKKLESIGS